jgi:uncharacterized membrane protein (UPF0127 family)
VTPAMGLCGVMLRILGVFCLTKEFLSRGLRTRIPRDSLGSGGSRHRSLRTPAGLPIRALGVGAGIVLLTGCGGRSQGRRAAATVSPLGSNLVTLQFKSPSGAESDLHVRVEATEADRERGLMGVTNLPQDEGDLFAWPDVAPNEDVRSVFWMKDTPLPLSIAFISADGKVLEIRVGMPGTRYR